jgi:hypothetical protein
MKKLIIISILMFSSMTMFSMSDGESKMVVKENPTYNTTTNIINVLKPISPSEATFEEDNVYFINELKPVVPMTADFEMTQIDLKPTTPKIATFEE